MNNLLPTDFQSFIHKSRYARWLEGEGRRESWTETVERYMKNIVEPIVGVGDKNSLSMIGEIEQAILNLDVMPSMRSLMTAGAAANRDNTCMYNCATYP